MAFSKESFEQLLKENRYDADAHRVYADWLEEHGFDDEAEFHRKWTPEWQKAYDWMDRFAREEVDEGGVTWAVSFAGQEVAGPITAEKVLAAVKQYLETGEEVVLSGLGFGASNALLEKEENKAFWEAYAVLTGTDTSKQIDERDCPFGCCY